MPLSINNDETSVTGERDIDVIARRVKTQILEAMLEQLTVTRPADDDGLWFFYLPLNRDDDIQIESSTGMCPFLIESNRDDRRTIGTTVDAVLSVVVAHLSTVGVA